ncbi:MAG: hypothetical protein ABIV50_13230 [Opitutus sp.]
MKTPKILLSFFVASLFATSFAFAQDAKQAGCCVKAEKKGEVCSHECCVAAAKDGKNCAKCGGSGEIAAKK